MARSSYVYVITIPSIMKDLSDDVLAAFTVKHELVSWLKSYHIKQPERFEKLNITRVPDGGRDAHPEDLNQFDLVGGGTK